MTIYDIRYTADIYTYDNVLVDPHVLLTSYDVYNYNAVVL